MLLLVAGGVVLLILFAVYRSPILPFVVIVSAIFALALAGLAVYLLADAGAIALNGQSQGILFILVFGAATDYALLLVARYREELRSVEDKYEAIRTAWRSTLEPIAASAATVIAGVLCLLLSDLNSNRGLGPVAAIGIAASFIASMTFLPAALVLLGRTAFWPTRPKVDPDADRGDLASAHRFWNSIAQKVGANPRPIWMVCSIVLVGFALLLPQFKAGGVASSDVFLLETDSSSGQQILGEHFDAGTGSPTIVVARENSLGAVTSAARVEGVTTVTPVTGPDGTPTVVDGRVAVQATLSDPADSLEAERTVERIRDAVHAVPDATRSSAAPLRSISTRRTPPRATAPSSSGGHGGGAADPDPAVAGDRAPVLLMLTVIVSYAATLGGVASLLFNHVFHFPGADPVVPLFGSCSWSHSGSTTTSSS